MQDRFPMIAKTVFGMEPLLADELRAQGASDVTPGRRLVSFTGDQRLLYRANLWCRTAIRVLKLIHVFPADHEQALYRGIREIDWAEFLDPTKSLTIDPVVFNSFCTHSLYAAQLSKDAIVDQFRERCGARPSVNRDSPDLRINLHINHNRVQVYLDASGDSLHKRGYRTAANEAPMNEVLAAGILQIAGWDGQCPFADFMCGSGTLPIEAALMARNIAPGSLREEFGYMRWKDFDARLHAELLKEAVSGELPSAPYPIMGSDLDERVIEIARQNARQAGVDDSIQFAVANFESALPPAPRGLLISNPPYNERLKLSRMEAVYQRIGEALGQNWPGYQALVFTGNLEAAEHIGLELNRKFPLFNGSIECRLLEYQLPDAAAAGSRATPTAAKPRRETPARQPADDAPAPASGPDLASQAGTAPPSTMPPSTGLPAERAEVEAQRDDGFDDDSDSRAWESDSDDFESEDDSTAPEDSMTRAASSASAPRSAGGRRTWQDQAEIYRNRLTRMAKHWGKWARRQGITCYRLYDRDVPEIPLAVDRFEDRVQIVEYDRPHDRTNIEQQQWLEGMAETTAQVLAIPRARMHVKSRARLEQDRRRMSRAGETRFVVQEAGHRFEVCLSDVSDTGLLLDRRTIRAMIEKEAAGKRFLSLFATTGAATVCAAAGGAVSTVTIDLSAAYLDRARRNMELNHFTQPCHQYLRASGIEYLTGLGQRPPSFDLVLIDPPTYAGVTEEHTAWDIARDHVELLGLVLDHLAPGGKIFLTTTSRRFKLASDALSRAAVRDISRQTVPLDFRNKRIHQCFALWVPTDGAVEQVAST